MEDKHELNPPSEEEFNRALAKRMFGKNAEEILKHAPWSFLIVKILWKKGEQPWEK